MDEISQIAKQLRQKETWLQAILDSAAELSNLSRALAPPSNTSRRLNDVLWQSNSPHNNPADPQRAQADVFKHAVINLVNLENELLDLASIESGDFKLDIIDFDLKSLVDHTFERVRLGTQSKELILRSTLSPSLPRAFSGDAARLQQILGNLLENATRRMNAGEIVLRIDPDTNDPHHLRLELTALCSISHCQSANPIFNHAPSQNQEQETAKPSSIDNVRLDFCKQLVRQMGGELLLGTDTASGRLFTLDVCFSASLTPHSDPAIEPKLAEDSSTALRILIAEDSEDSRFLLQEFLKGEAFTLTFAENGKQAFEVAQGHIFDLILMDIQMPVMDGLTATRLIRRYEHENGRSITPLLALTANARKSDIDLSLAAGCDAHILKPISKAGLLQAIQKHTLQPTPSESLPAKQEQGIMSRLIHSGELLPALMTNI